jgi:hypothetical protein
LNRGISGLLDKSRRNSIYPPNLIQHASWHLHRVPWAIKIHLARSCATHFCAATHTHENPDMFRDFDNDLKVHAPLDATRMMSLYQEKSRLL